MSVFKLTKQTTTESFGCCASVCSVFDYAKRNSAQGTSKAHLRYEGLLFAFV